jgi:ELWxxDGT repeat protein
MKKCISISLVFICCSYCKAQNTRLVKEVKDISNLTTLGDKVVFSGYDVNNGRELWVSDGTTDGTKILKDINIGSASSFPVYFQKFNDILVFETIDAPGVKLYRTDGTENGTYRIWDRGFSFDRGGGVYSKIFVDNNFYWGVYNSRTESHGPQGAIILKSLNSLQYCVKVYLKIKSVNLELQHNQTTLLWRVQPS